MLYETGRQLIYQSYQHWISTEFLSFGWFVIIGVLAIVYGIWLKVVDPSRIQNILLLGSLSAIGFIMADMVFISYLGVVEYKIRIFPWEPPIFIVSITIAPILLMFVYQYTSSWSGYTLWAGIAMAVLAFGLLPIYSFIGIYQLVKWNYFYQFILMFTGGVITRVLIQWLINLEQGHPASSRSYAKLRLQPVATKPLDSNEKNSTDNNE
jgi:hypothetical protein